jgi:DNA repair photolyase
LRRVKRDLAEIQRGSIIEMSTSSDPYPPIEEKLGLTRSVLEVLVKSGFLVLITTKSNIVARDADLLAQGSAAVMFTITTLREDIVKYIEPGAPSPKERLRAMKRLAEMGVPVGVRVDPVIPYVNDDPEDLKEVVEAAFNAGARHVVTSTYKAKWDSLRRLREKLPSDLGARIYSLYTSKGVRTHGYLYLPAEYRKLLLNPVISAAKSLGLTYATCREGFYELNKAPSCDGSHLARYKREFKNDHSA